MGTINIHLNENQSLEWGQCSAWIKARSHSLISVLILNPRGDSWPSYSSRQVQIFLFLILCAPVYFCVHQNWNLSIIIMARAGWCLKHNHTTESITSQGSKTTNYHWWFVRDIDLLQECNVHRVVVVYRKVWGNIVIVFGKQSSDWVSCAQLCLISFSLCLHICMIQENPTEGPTDCIS